MKNLPAKKSLGQNFLKSKSAIGDIVKAAELTQKDTVLEIGPGKGVLTEALLAASGKVIAVEKDDRLIKFLQEKFSEEILNGKFEIIHGDILDFNLNDLRNRIETSTYKLVANIPYYITGILIRTFLESDFQPEKMVLMVQKEVCDRIVARDGKESILSVSVKAYGTPKYIKKVPARYFSPAPKVDSAILLINNISKDFFTKSDLSEEHFFTVVKAGFAHKRKLAARNLESHFPKEKIQAVFAKLNISKTARPEEISLKNWREIAINH